MFAESFSYDASEIARHTWPQNGSISVLDFPGQAAISAVFGSGGSYTELLDYLHLESQLYQNPYELMTFYDNHDMPRMDADEAGFINAHNWLFTTRGTPVIYYGSEIGFRAGAREHAGNRDYFGAERVDRAREHPIRHELSSIANIRKASPALQRGLQVNLEFGEDTAAFYRVYRRGEMAETALVLLNKAAVPALIDIDEWQGGLEWRNAKTGEAATASSIEVPDNGVVVLLAEGVPGDAETIARLDQLMATARRN